MAELDSIDLEPRHLKKIRSIFARHLPYKKVWAYGSRVKWTASNTSDLDCVVFGATDSEIANAREAFDESDIPFEVQLLNWNTIPDDFKENIYIVIMVIINIIGCSILINSIYIMVDICQLSCLVCISLK